MKYRLVNSELEAQITEIQNKIRLSMNGIVSGQMTQNGIIYKKNFGVSIPRIKEIASLYTPHHDLAQRLWDEKIRETMILSTLLEPIETFSTEIARQRIKSFNQIEIVEQTCMNLFCKLSFSNSLCIEFVQSENEWTQITGFILGARIYEKLNHTEITAIIHQAINASLTNNFHLYKSVALCLSRFCRKDNETAAYILKEITAVFQQSSNSHQYILNEVKQEILFLNIL